MRTSPKRQEVEAQIAEARERGGLPDQDVMPVTLDGRLDLGLECKLRWGRDKYPEWVRKAVLISSLAERRKPGVRDTVMKHIDCMLVEGVLRPEQGHHMQQSELVLVEESWSWERAREKVYSWSWGAGVGAAVSGGWYGGVGRGLPVHWV